MLRFESPTDARDVVIEDDNRVAYAYLRDAGKVVGDVWLYNSVETPLEPDWDDFVNAPFRNPKALCSNEPFETLTEESRIRCEWSPAGADLYIDEVHWAHLQAGAKPGWSRLATGVGPLAHPLLDRFKSSDK